MGVLNTLMIAVLTLTFGFFLGLIIALMRRSRFVLLRGIGAAWVDFLRNTPFLIQLYFLFYGLPALGINTDPIVTAIIGLSINTSAPNCEAIRSGLLAIKKDYYQCAAALGLSQFQVFRLIIIPVALRLAFRSLTSNFINLVLTTSAAFTITVNELMGVSRTITARTSRPFEMYLFIMGAYCVFTFLLSFIAKAINRRIEITL
ncbi:MAG: amino acid ABC transporter permease [Treponema sp.]|jgi:polar amino acid transport system permease protein/putative glutamine transport system permease protein|nr:amino acid ABC transporter permease [Treponema sp.]